MNVIATTALAMCSVLASLPAAADELIAPIKIGVITDLTGPMAHWGNQTLNGVELAAEELRASGKHVELIIGDHHLDTKSAVSETQKMLGRDAVNALYVEFTPTAVASASAARPYATPLIYSAAAMSPLSQNPNTLKTYMDFTESCAELAAYWKRAGIRKPALLSANLEFSHLCGVGLERVYPGSPQILFEIGSDLSTHVLKLKTAQVDAVLSVSFRPEFEKMLQAMQKLNYHPEIGSQQDSSTAETLELYPQFESKILMFGFPEPNATFSAALLRRRVDGDRSSFAAALLGYLHVRQFVAAGERCPGLLASCIRENLQLSPPENALSFRGWKDRVAQFPVILKRWNHGVPVAIETSTSR